MICINLIADLGEDEKNTIEQMKSEGFHKFGSRVNGIAEGKILLQFITTRYPDAPPPHAA